MSYVQDQKPATPQIVPEIRENTGAGPLAPAPESQPNTRAQAERIRPRTKLERAGFWVIVAAALGVLLLMLGVLLPPIIGGIISGFYIAVFVGLLTMLNLSQPAAWGNSVIGRRVFPVVQLPDKDILRLAWVNGLLVFGFGVIFSVVSYFLHPFLAGILVFGALIAAGLFYGRVRTVVIKP